MKRNYFCPSFGYSMNITTIKQNNNDHYNNVKEKDSNTNEMGKINLLIQLLTSNDTLLNPFYHIKTNKENTLINKTLIKRKYKPVITISTLENNIYNNLDVKNIIQKENMNHSFLLPSISTEISYNIKNRKKIPSINTFFTTSSSFSTNENNKNNNKYIIKDCANCLQSKKSCNIHKIKKKSCNIDGCRKQALSKNKCVLHGGGKCCQYDGCTKAIQSRGRCKAHGGGTRCQYFGCVKSCFSKGFCRRHGGGVKCKIDLCGKWAQKLGFCVRHFHQYEKQIYI